MTFLTSPSLVRASSNFCSSSSNRISKSCDRHIPQHKTSERSGAKKTDKIKLLLSKINSLSIQVKIIISVVILLLIAIFWQSILSALYIFFAITVIIAPPIFAYKWISKKTGNIILRALFSFFSPIILWIALLLFFSLFAPERVVQNRTRLPDNSTQPPEKISNTLKISEQTFDGNYPFIVSSGILKCQNNAIIFTTNGRNYAINGTARMRYPDYPELYSILKDDPRGIAPKMSIRDVINQGLKLCK